MLWRPHDRHRNIRTWTRSTRLFARRYPDRHVVIEIASPATPQPSSLLPPRRRRSPDDAPGAFREHGRREKSDPIAARERSLATLYPSKSSLIVFRPLDNRRQRLSNPHRSRRRRRPSDSRFPSLEVFERRPCLGGQQWSMKGRHPKTFTVADIAAAARRQETSGQETRNRDKFHCPLQIGVGRGGGAG